MSVCFISFFPVTFSNPEQEYSYVCVFVMFINRIMYLQKNVFFGMMFALNLF